MDGIGKNHWSLLSNAYMPLKVPSKRSFGFRVKTIVSARGIQRIIWTICKPLWQTYERKYSMRPRTTVRQGLIHRRIYPWLLLNSVVGFIVMVILESLKHNVLLSRVIKTPCW